MVTDVRVYHSEIHKWRLDPLWRLWLFVSLSILIGCNNEARRHTVSRDSAGVRIVENSDAPSDPAPEWQLDSKPEVTIGAEAGGVPYELHDVRGAARLADGRFVFLNAGTNQVRFYDRRGAFLVSVGRKGEGPGEFRRPLALVTSSDDTMRVYDPSQRRVTVIAPAGLVARTQMTAASLSGLVGFLNSNTAVTGAPWWSRSNVEGVIEFRTIVRTVEINTGAADTVTVIGERQEYQSFHGEMRRLTPVPFTVYAQMAVQRANIYVTDGIRPEVRVYDQFGKVLDIFRVLMKLEPVSRNDYDAFVAVALSHSQADAAVENARVFARMPVRKSRPVYDDLVVGQRGDIWVRQFEAIPSTHRTWTVFDTDGRVVARVQTPSRLRVTQVGDDYILGVFEDENDVEYVQLYRLKRAGS